MDNELKNFNNEVRMNLAIAYTNSNKTKYIQKKKQNQIKESGNLVEQNLLESNVSEMFKNHDQSDSMGNPTDRGNITGKINQDEEGNCLIDEKNARMKRDDIENEFDELAKGNITNVFLQQSVKEYNDHKDNNKFFPLRKVSHLENYAGYTFITFNKVEDCLRMMRIFQAGLQRQLFGKIDQIEDKYLDNVKLSSAPY